MATSALKRNENLALLMQELFTVIVRIRAGRMSVSSVEAFRAQVKEALRVAGEAARRSGYSSEQTSSALLAVVALLDETVLGSANPAFRDWQRSPLQAQLFGVDVAGHTVFDQIRTLLSADDSYELADVLEVFELCLLLGYQGRYGGGRAGDLGAIRTRLADRIARIRGGAPDFSTLTRPPDEAVRPFAGRADQRYVYAALGVAVLMMLAWAVYKLVLLTTVNSLALIFGASTLRI
jgi:type VI secretion system protein ImpK